MLNKIYISNGVVQRPVSANSTTLKVAKGLVDEKRFHDLPYTTTPGHSCTGFAKLIFLTSSLAINLSCILSPNV